MTKLTDRSNLLISILQRVDIDKGKSDCGLNSQVSSRPYIESRARGSEEREPSSSSIWKSGSLVESMYSKELLSKVMGREGGRGGRVGYRQTIAHMFIKLCG